MVLRYLFSIIFSLSCIFSFTQDSLFFTDSYSTNLYKSSKNTITFSNNLFAALDEQHIQKVDSFFQLFFTVNNIQIEGNYVKNDFQFIYEYKDLNTNYLEWSRNWFQKNEGTLLNILNQFTLNYLNTVNDTFPSIHEASLYKLSLNAFYNYNNRVNDATSTSINICSKSIDIDLFNKNNLIPNNSLKRMITSTNSNFFNESFYFKNTQAYQYFIINTTKKSRLIDCFSAHIMCHILNIDPPVYLNNISYLKFNQIDQTAFTQEAIDAVFTTTQKEFEEVMNNSNVSFYNLYDIYNLEHTLENYNINDLNKYIELFIEQNTQNKVLNLTEEGIPYNHSMLNDTLHFKVNSYRLTDLEDSLKLASIAAFLTANPLKEIQILGLANNSEYTKVDKKKYTELIEIYKSYTPIKVSKKINLPLYRSLLVFEFLFKKGVDPKTMICISKKVKNSEENLAIVYFSYKL